MPDFRVLVSNKAMNRDFMRRAIELAREAAAVGEIPVGAVVVKDGKIIGEGRNMREEKHDALSHAETEAISAACNNIGDWRLDGCEIYVTLEPCPMCTGAIINARISAVIFGAYDLRAGCMDSVINLCDYPFESRPEIYGGIMEDECAEILTAFFEGVRNERKN